MDPRLDIDHALQLGRGVVTALDHPELRDRLEWLCRRGEMVRLLPSTFCAAQDRERPEIRIRAVLARHPDAVLTGAAAARLSFWPEARLPCIEAALPGKVASPAGYHFSRRDIPLELIVERDGWRYTAPALTALDLATFENTDPIDIALRTRAATLDLLHEALRLTPGRDGNVERTRLLLDSRDNPWSAAERRAQRLLRAAGITGWRGNLPITLCGRQRYLDIGFRRLRLGLEIDGRIHSLDPVVFEEDRIRQNQLLLDGWLVLRFTWTMIEDEPEEFIETVREGIAMQTRRAR